MKSLLFYALLLLTLLAACKESDNENRKESTETSGISAAEPTGLSEGHDNTFLTDKLFHYDAAFSVGSESTENPYKDQWIDLLPDGTYKAGKLKDQTHKGKWGYNVEQKTLLLKPDDRNFKISEWKVMHNNDMVIWVGTQTYGNNATQIKLVKRTELPGN